MKSALSGLLVAMLATAVPALAQTQAQTGTRYSGGYHRQAVSTQAQSQTGTRYSGGYHRQAVSTQAQTGTRYSGGRQAGSTQAQTGTRYSGGRQAGSTQAQTGTRYSGGNHRQAALAQAQTGTTQAQTGTRDSGVNFRDRQRQGTQQGWRSGEQSHVQGQARDFQRERPDGDRRGFGHDGRFGHGNGYAYGRQDNWRDGRFQNGNGYAYGHDRQNNWRNRDQVSGWDPSIDRRQDRQRERIVQGIRSGELTQREAQRLIAEQRMIRQEERRYKSDGVLTDWERRDLQRDLDVASQHIYNQTHDAQTRYSRDGRFQNGQGYAYGHTNRPWGHQIQDNWQRGHQYGQVRGWDPSIDRRQDRQHDRIVQGIRSGELTQREAQRLIAEQRMIRQEERLYKSDGVVTPWERRDLQQDLDVASQNIYNQTHDAQTRY